jgi:hypothetical protein
VRISVHPLYDTDATTEVDAIAEIERIAALLGVPARVEHGHHVACADFGMVSYEALVVTQAAMDLHNARDSYRDCISTDPSRSRSRGRWWCWLCSWSWCAASAPMTAARTRSAAIRIPKSST